MELVDSTGTVFSEAAFRAAHPFTSFPANLREQDVQPFGYSIVVPTTPPAPLPFHNNVESAPTLVDGVWMQTWSQVSIDVSNAQAIQSAALDAACAQAIVSGFTSSALGSPHTYPSKHTDQLNLTASYVSSLSPNLPDGWTTKFWCADSTGKWAWADHTAAQIQQVGLDGKAAVMACQDQNAKLQAQLFADTITTVDQVAAIVWTAPSA